MADKFAAHLAPGDQITLHGIDQTITRVEMRVGPTAAVFTDYTGDDPWLLDPGQHVTIRPAVDKARKELA